MNRRTKQEQSQACLSYALQEGGRPKVNNEIIETERLLLRRWKLSDADALYKYACDPEVGPHAGWPPHKSVEESKMIIREVFTNDFTWAIVLKETNEPIGCMGYYPFGKSNIGIGENDAEVGYWIGKTALEQRLLHRSLASNDSLLLREEQLPDDMVRFLHRQSSIWQSNGEMRFYRYRQR